ncbi:MAG: glycosyltransferase family 2 protein [Bacteroidota bacterium]
MNPSPAPFFSFVTATFNRAEFLPRLIQSMKIQTFADFEILIIDDGSTDNTLKILNDISKDEVRLRFIHQENMERGAARNNGISNAKGRYVVFVDSDDTFDANHLELLHQNIIRLDFPDFICNKFDVITGSKVKNPKICGLKPGWYDYRLLLDGNVLGMYHAVRRDNAGLKPFEQDRAYAILEDWMFNFENLRNNRIYVTDDITYHLHDHPERSMRSNHSEIIRIKMKAIDWIISRTRLTSDEISKLKSQGDFFAAVHFRLAGDFTAAMFHLRKSLNSGGLKIKHIKLFLKLIFGLFPKSQIESAEKS